MADAIKKLISDRRQLGEGIYLLYFALMVGARAAGLYEGMTIYNISLVLGLGLFVLKMIVTQHTVKEYVVAALFLALGGIVYIHTGEKGLFVCFTMMLGMKGVSTVKAIRTGGMVAGVFIIFKVFHGVFGLLPEIYYPQERDGVGLMFRHALGYAHPNTLHMNVLMLTMMLMFLLTVALMRNHDVNTQRMSRFVLILASVMAFMFNVYIFLYSGSRTGLLASFIYLFINAYLYLRGKIGIFEKICLYISFPFVCFISIVLPFLLEGDLFEFVDRTVFTTRFSLARYFWSNNHISLFGIRLVNPQENLKTYGIDMAQLYLFLQLGLVAFVVIAALTIWFINRAIKKDMRAELAVLMGMLFLGMWEPLLYNLGFKNFIYVFMGQLLYEALSGATFTESECTEKSLSFFQDINPELMKTTLSIISISLVVGIVASTLYLTSTKTPDYLYGDREQSEAGESFGMDPMYISETELAQIEGRGNIVIGYVDETVPMYQFGPEIAEMEYQKRAISFGVWTGAFAMICLLLLNKRRKRYNANV
jgi:hypothetical protein